MEVLLIINADDLGYAAERDNAIFALFEHQTRKTTVDTQTEHTSSRVTSATILANGRTAIEATKIAKRLNMPLGLHLNLTEGAPLASCVPSLVVSVNIFTYA